MKHIINLPSMGEEAELQHDSSKSFMSYAETLQTQVCRGLSYRNRLMTRKQPWQSSLQVPSLRGSAKKMSFDHARMWAGIICSGQKLPALENAKQGGQDNNSKKHSKKQPQQKAACVTTPPPMRLMFVGPRTLVSKFILGSSSQRGRLEMVC